MKFTFVLLPPHLVDSSQGLQGWAYFCRPLEFHWRSLIVEGVLSVRVLNAHEMIYSDIASPMQPNDMHPPPAEKRLLCELHLSIRYPFG